MRHFIGHHFHSDPEFATIQSGGSSARDWNSPDSQFANLLPLLRFPIVVMLLTIAILVIAGVILMILETFVPGWVAGILGGLCVLAAIILVIFADDFDTWSPGARTTLACGIIVFSVGAMLLWMRSFGLQMWQKNFTLRASIPPQKPTEPMPQDTEGVAISELRPLGRVDFGGVRREVRCEDGFAPAGSKVRVTGAEPGNLLVRLIQ
jgi:membrane-bound serine protease (ClpP class)